jgi:alanyl-tRNA synthetase
MDMSSKEIRQAFLDYFSSLGHQIVPSAPMVIQNDSTLMFTNAGMNQFKDLFLGNEPITHKRMANSQKCLRVSGKHNDLEEVGHDTYHHTMFEMLGNWSFGDYFKKEAIQWAWEFLTGILGIEKDRLYATVFEGDRTDGMEMDEEAWKCWSMHLSTDHILKGTKKDNFWEMGDTGPCGPCSEIHVDIRPASEREKKAGAELVNKDHPRLIEIWNLVFIQYNRKSNGELEALPEKHIDTGLGLERLAMVLQGKDSSYDTDIFQSLISRISDKTDCKYGAAADTDVSMRVVADHIRAVSFSIADGQLPSNNKAGYVIRRILRRAVRYGYTFLGQDHPFMYRLVGTLVREMGDAYPELKDQRELIEKVVREEETSFLKTLDKGIHMLDELITDAKGKKQSTIDGRSAFVLYDTYGFPFDLTRLILREHDLDVSQEDFEKDMASQKSRSRNAASVSHGDWQEIRAAGPTRFLGYDQLTAEIRISRYRKTEEKKQIRYQLVFDQTPFYAESGGQIGDTGTIENAVEKIQILDTQKEHNLIIHLTDKLPADLEGPFTASVDLEKRLNTACHHTSTHLLHHALRKVLGKHVEQKGSLVHPEYLRFDFSHFKKLDDSELDQIEKLVNRLIRDNIPLQENRSLPMKDAREMGAIAFFGEKYGERVRVIKFGDSVELCGGIHVKATGNIGFLKILKESAIASGIRRIEAVAGPAAEKYVDQRFEMLKKIEDIFKTPDILTTIDKTLSENAQLKKLRDEYSRDIRAIVRKNLIGRIRKTGRINLIAEEIPMRTADDFKSLAFELKAEVENLVLVLGGNLNGKAHLTIMIADPLVKDLSLDARRMIREIAADIQGGGGGQDFYATAGGQHPGGIPQAITKIAAMLEKAQADGF